MAHHRLVQEQRDEQAERDRQQVEHQPFHVVPQRNLEVPIGQQFLVIGQPDNKSPLPARPQR